MEPILSGRVGWSVQMKTIQVKVRRAEKSRATRGVEVGACIGRDGSIA
jgi:hypothetical protein